MKGKGGGGGWGFREEKWETNRIQISFLVTEMLHLPKVMTLFEPGSHRPPLRNLKPLTQGRWSEMLADIFSKNQ